MHKFGSFELDILLQRLLIKVKIKLISDERRMKFIQHDRDDYFRNNKKDNDRILLNPE